MIKIIISYIFLIFLINCQEKQKKIAINIEIYANPHESLQTNELDTLISLNENQIMNINNITKPSYNVYIRSKNTQFIVLVDDVPAFKFFDKETQNGTGMNGNVPLNHCLLKSGKHIITGKLFPKYGSTKLNDGTFLTLETSVRESGTIDMIQLFELKTPEGYYKKSSPDDQENNGNGKWIIPLEGLPYYELNGEFEIKLPFEIEGWTNSVNLKEEMENGKDLKKEVHSVYSQIKQIIESRNTQDFSKLIKQREQLLAKAFYFNQAKQAENLTNFLELIKNPDYELAPLPQNAVISFYGYGKLVTLLNIEQEGVIKLINKKDKNEEVILDFYFHRKKTGDKLEVIF